MISKKSIYGLQATILLAKRYNSGPVLITDLAREGHIPKKFLEAILLELRKKDILKSMCLGKTRMISALEILYVSLRVLFQKYIMKVKARKLTK